MSSDSPDGALLSEAEFVLCIDSVGRDGLHMHVSKQPKAGTPAERMLRAFRDATELLYPNTTVQVVPKKVMRYWSTVLCVTCPSRDHP